MWEGEEREYEGCSEGSNDGDDDQSNTDRQPTGGSESGPESSQLSIEESEGATSDDVSSGGAKESESFSDGAQGYEEEDSGNDERVKVDDSGEGKPALAAGAINTSVVFSILAMTLL